GNRLVYSLLVNSQPVTGMFMPVCAALFNAAPRLCTEEVRNKDFRCRADVASTFFILNHADLMLKTLCTNRDGRCYSELQCCMGKRRPMVVCSKKLNKLFISIFQVKFNNGVFCFCPLTLFIKTYSCRIHYSEVCPHV